jgi:hypothetical protein
MNKFFTAFLVLVISACGRDEAKNNSGIPPSAPAVATSASAPEKLYVIQCRHKRDCQTDCINEQLLCEKNEPHERYCQDQAEICFSKELQVNRADYISIMGEEPKE